MTDDAKQAAWRRFCEQLEALGVNPHSPEVPEDDPRHEQVQAIVAEYRDHTLLAVYCVTQSSRVGVRYRREQLQT